MLLLQGKRGFLVRFAIEEGWFETGFAVTGAAIATSGTDQELPLVRVFMAVLAFVMCDGAVKVGILVTMAARSRGMLSVQCELRHCVIELDAGTILLPAASVMAGFAATANFHVNEGAAMRIFVAALAA